MVNRFRRADAFLHRHDPTFPLFELAPEEIALQSEPAGQGPLFRLGKSQIQTVWETERLRLDATWTAPTFAALLEDADRDHLRDQTVLLWHTYNSRPYPPGVEDIDHRALPRGFHFYFTGPVQEVNVPSWLMPKKRPA
jgi:hypothetical protein